MHNILFYNSMKYIQNCMDCFHICMDCLYSLYELSPQNFCRGNPYNFFKLNISLILLIWRYSGICQSTVNTWSIVLYHRFILRLFCWILVNVFPLVVWIAPILPYNLYATKTPWTHILARIPLRVKRVWNQIPTFFFTWNQI